MKKEKSSKKARPAPLVYRLEKWFSEGLLIATVLLLVCIIGFFLFVRWHQLPDVAAWVPAEDTLVVGVVSVPQLLHSTSSLPDEAFLSASSMETLTSTFVDLHQDWFAGDLGVALIKDDLVFLIRAKSKKEAMTYYESLLTEGETLEASEFGRTKIYSYPESHPIHFAFFGPFVAVSQNSEPLEAMAQVKSGELDSLKSSGQYKNVRSRLPHFASSFVYVNLPQSRLHVAQILARMGVAEPGYLEPLLKTFPAMGMTISMEKDGWYVENFTAVDKKDLDGKGLAKIEGKYKQDLLAWSLDGYTSEWGGHNAVGKISRMIDSMAKTHTTATVLFESVLRAKAQELFGDNVLLDEEIYPLLDKEYWVGWNSTDPKGFAFIVELEEGEATQVYGLKDLMVLNTTLKRPVIRNVKMLNGSTIQELQAEILSLSQSDHMYESIPYSKIVGDGEDFVYVAITDTHLFGASHEDALFEMIDKWEGREPERELSNFSALLPGSEDIFTLNTLGLAEENALATLLQGFASISMTQKIFDDGIITRQSLLFE